MKSSIQTAHTLYNCQNKFVSHYKSLPTPDFTTDFSCWNSSQDINIQKSSQKRQIFKERVVNGAQLGVFSLNLHQMQIASKKQQQMLRELYSVPSEVSQNGREGIFSNPRDINIEERDQGERGWEFYLQNLNPRMDNEEFDLFADCNEQESTGMQMADDFNPIMLSNDYESYFTC